MATLNANVMTLQDWAKRLDPERKGIARIVELLSMTNEILQDMMFIEGNLPTGNRTTVRTGLPTVAWRLLNQGVQPSKSRTAQIDETCGKLEAWSEVDVALAKLNSDVAAFRLSESTAFIEAMNQEMASTVFYGNQGVAPEEFTGLAVRYSAISGATNGSNVITGGGSGSDNTSIWLVVWGDQTCCGVYPKGSSAGLQFFDHGEQTIETSTGIGGTRMRAYQSQWVWDCGIVLKDWRYVVRIPNIDVSNLVGKSSAADLIELMIKAIHRIPNMNMGRPAFYMNRTVMQMLDIQRRDEVQTGGQLAYDKVDGVWQPSFRGIPLRKCDAILETEATVS